jgi:hypothetical protein
MGGVGSTDPGNNGVSNPTDAGGVLIGLFAGPVCKTADTKITLNQADTNPDVDGTIGAC